MVSHIDSCCASAGDVYVGSGPVHQDQITELLERHDLTIDRIITTPTAALDTSLEGKDSMERGHKVLSCRTSVHSMPDPKMPDIKLHLKVPFSSASTCTCG